jgi:putative intracellular protease/amidase
MLKTPLFRDHPTLPHPKSGPLLGKRVLAVVAPTGANLAELRRLASELAGRGVDLRVASETHGEAQGARGEPPVFPDCLLVTVKPEAWDAVVFIGGEGALRVAEDPYARELAQKFAALGRPVAALGEGARVLERAAVSGITTSDGRQLATALAERLAA